MMKERLQKELICIYGESAEFREGQLEAILSVLEGKRTLVVQKTGWGKSLVYFLATKVLRSQGKGATVVISPLLALMNNQIDSAMFFGLSAATINSNNIEEWDEIVEKVLDNKIDVLIISPERLSNEVFMTKVMNVISRSLGMFVVDEAHCISDWGHDFRPDYRRILNIIKYLPSNVPLLATTATANDRVVEDIKKQLGSNITVSRGTLTRDSLAIQVIHMSSKEERLAWLSDHLNELPGVGIIYCLTVSDCSLVSGWLNSRNIVAHEYTGKMDANNRNEIQQLFMLNKMKVLVATVAFGMGIDKSDIGFVVHFQKPGNVVTYYQQIGRAGRGITRAIAILFDGQEDDKITEFFIASAFPTEYEMEDIIRVITNLEGASIYDVERNVNMKHKRIEACLKYLSVNGDIYKEGSKYYKSPKVWVIDNEHSIHITDLRHYELKRMNDFVHTQDCYMKYVAGELNDTTAKACGKCSNCLHDDIISNNINKDTLYSAERYIKSGYYIIEPRKVWPSGVKLHGKNKVDELYRHQEGIVLSNYGDAGWGRIVAECKYKNNEFSQELVDVSYNLLKDYVVKNDITWVTNISSLRRPNLVKNFTMRLAIILKLEYIECIEKVIDSVAQKKLNNSSKQFENVDISFAINDNILSGNVLLVDDMVDSRWTLTVCSYKMIRKGCGKVFPFALANTAGTNGDD